MILINVTSGAGQITINFGPTQCEAVSLISPDDTPMYDFEIRNQDGFYVVGATDIDAQRVKINESFQLDGLCTLYVRNAVDDGTYSIQVYPK